jgi:NAD(P)-dependent dehydrogenase (short-subunit alcohol dehydrogenase family)
VVAGDEARVAVITGGSHGIGAALVRAYRARGWSVVANARTIEATADPGVVTVEGDVSDPGAAEEIMRVTLERFGQVDTLINNAGVYLSKPFTDFTAADYALVTGVNLAGFFWLTQRAIAAMLPRGRGHVVNISATIAERPESGTPAALTALTKAGLAAVARSLAVEYGSRGIRVNAVAPGVIATPLHGADSEPDPAGLPPLGRLGQVSDVVDAIMYLESARYVTGEVLHVDGGQNVGH